MGAALVSELARISSEEISLTVISLFLNFSRKLLNLMSMCLLFEFDPKFLSFASKPLFSMWNRVGSSLVFHNSSIRNARHWFSCSLSNRAFILDSVDDMVILHCFLLFHSNRQNFQKYREPLLDTLVSWSSPQVTSVKKFIQSAIFSRVAWAIDLAPNYLSNISSSEKPPANESSLAADWIEIGLILQWPN